MATDKPILRQTKKCATGSEAGEKTLEKKQYFLVKVTTSDTLELAASGDSAYPLYDTPKEGEYGTIVMVGIAKVVCGGSIEEGELVAANNKGEAQKAASTQKVVGVALEKGESGQIIKIQIPTGAKA